MNAVQPAPMMLHMRVENALRGRLFRLLWSRRFGTYGKGTQVVAPIAIEGASNIHLGSDVLIAAQSCLAATPLTGSDSCRLEIGDGSRIGRFNHIYATRRIRLGSKVLTANGVYISDNLHGYRDPEVAVLDQPIVQTAEVEIGEGSWIGHNACIIGASIGRHCIVGANAVLTRSIPDFCVAVGAPAVIIRRFDAASETWLPTKACGEFA